MDPSEVAGDPSFDRYARLVRRLLGVPTALVSIVEENRQVFPGAVGLPEPYQLARQTPLTHSFCQYVVHDDRPLVITDARLTPASPTTWPSATWRSSPTPAGRCATAPDAPSGRCARSTPSRGTGPRTTS